MSSRGIHQIGETETSTEKIRGQNMVYHPNKGGKWGSGLRSKARFPKKGGEGGPINVRGDTYKEWCGLKR